MPQWFPPEGGGGIGLTRLGKYELLGELGRGAFGIVYRARDPIINRMVALKTMTTSLADNPSLLRRFYREAQSAGSLQHPNIVTIYEMGDEGGAPFIAMELVDGPNLEHLIASRPTLPVSLKLVYATQACRAFDYAHKRGIIHRDIKPGNLMVNKEGTVKVVDFGIARILQTSKTHTGALIGTFSYMPPEMFHGEHASERSDIWSFGVLLYELLAYTLPFSGGSPAALMQSICLQEPIPLRQKAPDCPEDLEAVVHRTLRKTETERFQMMEDLLLELDPICKRLQAETVAGILEQVRALAEQGEFEQARSLLRQALQVDATNLAARALAEKINSELKRLTMRSKAQQLVERGRALLQEGKLQEASAEAENALHLHASFEPAQELQQDVQCEIKRIRLVNEYLQSAKQRLVEGLPEEAEVVLRKLQAVDPSHQHLAALQQQAKDEKQRRQRRDELLKGMQEARVLWTSQSYQACIDLLTCMQQAFPGEDEIVRLLETAREDQAEQKKQENLAEARGLLMSRRYGDCIVLLGKLTEDFPGENQIEKLLQNARDEEAEQAKQECLAEARKLMAVCSYDECTALLTRLKQQFPREDEISRLLATAREDQEEQNKQAQLGEARNLLAAGRYEECLAALAKLHQEFSGDAEIGRLLDTARVAKAEQDKQARLGEARSLLVARRYEDCIALLTSFENELSGEEEVRKLLETASKEQIVHTKSQQCLAARNLLAACRYEECIALLVKLEEAFPEDAEIFRLLETARENQAEEIKQKQLGEVRKLLAARRYTECIAILTALEQKFPAENEICRLLGAVRQDQAEQDKRKKLAEARKLLSARRYEECTALLAKLQQDLPHDDEIARSLANTLEEQAEHDKKQKLAAARSLFAAQRFADALAVLDMLLANDPKDSAVIKLRTVVHREQEKQKASETLQSEWEILKKLVSDRAYAEVVSRAEALLRQFPGEADLMRLVDFARSQQAEMEGELRLRAALDEVRRFLRANHFSEAASAARAGLESFSGNAEFLGLLEQAEASEKKEMIRQVIERRIREIKVKINRGQLSEAKELARETLTTLGPDTDVNQLLTSAEVEYEAREKNREQEQRLEGIRSLIRSGKLDDAATAVESAMKNGDFHALDPRVYQVADEIEAARKAAAAATLSIAEAEPEKAAREYVVLEGPPFSVGNGSGAELQSTTAAAASVPKAPAVPPREDLSQIAPAEATPAAALAAKTSSGAELTPAAVDRAGRILARYIGPIAIVLSKRAAQRTDSLRALYRLLAEDVESKVERARFLRDAGFPDA